MHKNTCCFVGHSKLPVSKMVHILWRLNDEIEQLIQAGVNTFISGGAVGFDQMAGVLIAGKKEMGYAIRLEVMLPHADQAKPSTQQQKDTHRYLLESADVVNFISEFDTNHCLKTRNSYIVDRSGYCICALLHNRSYAGQTVRYALRQNLCIINVAKYMSVPPVGLDTLVPPPWSGK